MNIDIIILIVLGLGIFSLLYIILKVDTPLSVLDGIMTEETLTWMPQDYFMTSPSLTSTSFVFDNNGMTNSTSYFPTKLD